MEKEDILKEYNIQRENIEYNKEIFTEYNIIRYEVLYCI